VNLIDLEIYLISNQIQKENDAVRENINYDNRNETVKRSDTIN
jgi:hypothetical protein